MKTKYLASSTDCRRTVIPQGGMTARERFKEWTAFGGVDRPLRWEWAFRTDATELWYQQGLSGEIPGTKGWSEIFGLDRGSPWTPDPGIRTSVDVNLGPLPFARDEILAEDGETVTVRDGWGTVKREIKTGCRSIPQYLSFPVSTKDDFHKLLKMWDPSAPERYPNDWGTRLGHWKNRDYPLRMHVHGWYDILRILMGMEELSMALIEQESLIEEVSEFWGDFLIRSMDRATAEADIDYVLFWEDLAFKTSSLLSPAHFRRYFLPHYKRVISFFRSRGIKHFMVDSDGNIEGIIPLWIEAGIDIIGPFEVTAGMDVAKTGREYPGLIMFGGVDKQEIAKGKDAIEAELMRRIPPLLDRGGYIPALDHATIPEISLEDYAYYRRRVHELHTAP